MTQKGLLNNLKKHGIVLYDPKHEKFDPNKHEAVFDYEDETLVLYFSYYQLFIFIIILITYLKFNRLLEL